MPAWLLNLLIKLASVVGVPLLKVAFPGLSQEILGIITELLSHIHASDSPAAAVKQVKEAVRSCTGAACPTDLVK